jgi:alginate O-acetyltransferase complex protein AlgI
MVFSSIIFLLFFLPVFLAAYYAVPRKARNYVVLIFSIIFFAWGAPDFLPFMLGSCLANYYLVKLMGGTSRQNIKRLIVGLSVVLNLALLFYFKYANFFLENVSAIRELFGSPSLTWERIVLPIGISFFTFTSITYSVDVYRLKHEPLKSPIDYLLYIMMFPHLLAGPIIRFEFIANQIRKREDTWSNILYGFYRFTLGLAKKVLIADVLALEVDRILGLSFPVLDSASAWIAIIAYTFQLYFDFSGYSDMAIGLARMIGFRFPENFDNPYISGSVTEFWRRWHMTFSNFMRHYVYYPLGGNRVNTQRRLYFNLWLVFLISGLWHGASWNFVLYGAFHGFFMVSERVFLSKIYARIGKIIPIAITFFVIVLSRVFFRIEDLPDAIGFMKVLFSFRVNPGMIPVNYHFYAIMVVAIVFSFITLSRFGLKLQSFFYERIYSEKEHKAMTWLYAILLILSIASLTGQGFSPFIYFRF